MQHNRLFPEAPRYNIDERMDALRQLKRDNTLPEELINALNQFIDEEKQLLNGFRPPKFRSRALDEAKTALRTAQNPIQDFNFPNFNTMLNNN